MRTWIAVAAIALALGCAHGDATEAPGGPAAIPVKLLEVSTRTSVGEMTATGTVEAEESVEIRPEASGPVQSVGFDHGKRVVKGDVLLRLRDASAQAEVSEAEAVLSLAETRLARTQALFERSNASAADLDTASADRDLAKAQLDSAREELRKTVVRAPFDGVTGLRLVAPGEVIDPTRVITRIEAIDRVVVDVAAGERWVPLLAPGLPVHVEVDALPGEHFEGEVVFVGPRVEAGTRAAPVRVKVPNEGGRLRPGMTARVQVRTSEVADALLVPTQAVVTSSRGAAVWVYTPEGTVEPRPVETAERTNDEVRVVSGLVPGERIVVEGLVRLRPGAAVRIVEGDVATTAVEAP